jgi:hypothetical protein
MENINFKLTGVVTRDKSGLPAVSRTAPLSVMCYPYTAQVRP